MASIRKRKTSANFWACITLPDGTRRQFSTGLTDRAEALALAVSTERALRTTKATPLHQRLNQIADDYAPEYAVHPSTWLRQWVARRQAEVSPATARSYKNACGNFADGLDSAGITSFGQITTPILARIRDNLAASMAPSTVNLRVDILRVALSAALDEGLITKNPASKLPNLATPPATRREFRPDEIGLLLSTVTGEWLTLTLLGLYTGQRLNDLATLTWRNVDLSTATIRFHTSKTRTLISLPLLKPLHDNLLSLSAPDKPDTPILPQIASLPASSRSNAFHRILVDAGILPKTKRTKNDPRQSSPLSFHSLRHTTTSMLKAAGVSDAIARSIIGHASQAISDHYTHFDLDTIRHAMAKILPSS